MGEHATKDVSMMQSRIEGGAGAIRFGLRIGLSAAAALLLAFCLTSASGWAQGKGGLANGAHVAYAIGAQADGNSDGQYAVSFDNSQFYDGKLYVGDLRTNAGDKQVTAIPGSVAPPVSAEKFLFANGAYYYVENFKGNGTGKVSLHRVDLATGEDVVLSDLVSSASPVYYENGVITCQMFSEVGAFHILAVDGTTRSKELLTFDDTDKPLSFVGTCDGYAYCSRMTTTNAYTVYRCPLTGGTFAPCLLLNASEVAVGFFDGRLITAINDKLAAYDKDGLGVWTCSAPEGAICYKTYCSDGFLYYNVGGLGDKTPIDIMRIGLADGSVSRYPTGMPIVQDIMYANDACIYYCAKEDGSPASSANGDYVVCELDIASGSTSILARETSSGQATGGQATGGQATGGPAAGSQSSGAQTSGPQPVSNQSGETYATEYFTVELPPSWGTDWKAELQSEYREAMNATNYIYVFSRGGTPMFSLSARAFNMGLGERIGTGGGRSIELSCTNALSPDDEQYIRSHVKLK